MEISPFSSDAPDHPPGYDSSVWNGRPLGIVTAVCLPIILIFSCLRFYTKYILVRKRSTDDYAFLLALIAGIAYIALQLGLTSTGPFGHHIWELSPSAFPMSTLRAMLAVEILYGPVMWIVKTSLFLLFLGIFGSIRWLRYCVYIGITSTGLFYLATSMVLAVSCWPKSPGGQSEYRDALLSPQCSPRDLAGRGGILSVIVGLSNCIINIYILVIPLPAVWALHLPTKTKAGISAIILSGLAAWIASSVGVAYRFRATSANDPTWVTPVLWLINVLEITVGLVVPCMPTVAKFSQTFARPTSAYFATQMERIRTPSKLFPIDEEKGKRASDTKYKPPPHRTLPKVHNKARGVSRKPISANTYVSIPLVEESYGDNTLHPPLVASVRTESQQSRVGDPASTNASRSHSRQTIPADLEKPLPSLPAKIDGSTLSWQLPYPNFGESGPSHSRGGSLTRDYLLDIPLLQPSK